MPWGRLDDGLNDDDKLNALCSDAFRLWVRGLVYCQKKLTDGFIADSAIPSLAAFAKERDRSKLTAELCARLVVNKGPLWHREEGGYRMHDYHDYNDRSDTVKRERELSKERMQRFRKRSRYGVTGTATNGATVGATNDVTNGVATPSVQTSTTTYHGTDKKQERADALLRPVEPVENRNLLQWRRSRSRETSSGKPPIRVITALARSVLTDYPTVVDEGELLELVKVACARANLLYDSASAGQAIDTARAHLRKRKDIPA